MSHVNESCHTHSLTQVTDTVMSFAVRPSYSHVLLVSLTLLSLLSTGRQLWKSQQCWHGHGSLSEGYRNDVGCCQIWNQTSEKSDKILHPSYILLIRIRVRFEIRRLRRPISRDWTSQTSDCARLDMSNVRSREIGRKNPQKNCRETLEFWNHANSAKKASHASTQPCSSTATLPYGYRLFRMAIHLELHKVLSFHTCLPPKLFI